MKITINLSKLHFFNNLQAIEKLKGHFSLHRDFMVHQIAVATGCPLDQALTICLLLYYYNQAEIYILLYRQDLEFNPIYKTKLSDGMPKVPFYSEENDLDIESLDHITYDIWAVLKRDSDFQFGN